MLKSHRERKCWIRRHFLARLLSRTKPCSVATALSWHHPFASRWYSTCAGIQMMEKTNSPLPSGFYQQNKTTLLVSKAFRDFVEKTDLKNWHRGNSNDCPVQKMPRSQRHQVQIKKTLAGVLSDLRHWSTNKGGVSLIFGKRALSLLMSLSEMAVIGKDSWIWSSDRPQQTNVH